MEKVYEDVGLCPVCGNKTLKVELYRYDLPTEGPSILFVGRCSTCGARIADVIPLQYGKEVEVTYETDPETLRKIVYLPGDTEIRIPELGVELTLTPAFKGRITTVEGILRMLEEETPDEKIKEAIREAAEGKRKVKLIIKNKNGLFREIQPRV